MVFWGMSSRFLATVSGQWSPGVGSSWASQQNKKKKSKIEYKHKYSNKNISNEVQGQKQPKTAEVDVVDRREPAASASPAVPGAAAPGTPTQDAVLSITATFGIFD